MQENENDVVEQVPTVEERQAEEFASEMQAEPQNIDAEPGHATNEEEAVAAGGVGVSPPESSDSPAAPPDALAGEPAESPAAPPDALAGEPAESPAPPREELSTDEILAIDTSKEHPKWPAEDAELTAMLEAVIYVTDEPLTLEQISTALEQPRDRIKRLLDDLVAEWQKPHHGLSIREVAGGYKMATKAEHHDAVRQFVKSLKAPMKLSLPALETLAVIAYKQPVTAPEVMDIRGVQGAGVLKTLIERKLIAAAGRKNVLGKPILYKTTKEFLVQFGLKDLAELPSVKEFEELARFATSEPESVPETAPETAQANPPGAEPNQPKNAASPEPQPQAPPVEASTAEASTAEAQNEEPQPESAAEPVAD